MVRIRLTQSANGFADFSIYEIPANRISTREISRKIPEKWLFSFANEFTNGLKRYYHVSVARKNSALEFEKQLKKNGHALTKLLFGAEWPFQSLFRSEPENPVVFTIDKQYSHIPFEILSDGELFLCDQRPILRTIRSERLPTRPKLFSNWFHRKNILLPVAATDKPEVLKSALAERNALLHEFARHRISVKIQAPNVPQLRLSTLLENMLSADFLHLTGHSTDLEIPLSDGEALSPQDIAGLNLQNLQLVFLNSCESALQNNPASQESFATAFIGAGVRNFIGYSHPIANQAAEIIGLAFWRHLNKGDESHIALFKALQKLRGSADLAAYRFLVHHFGDVEVSEEKAHFARRLAIATTAILLLAGSSLWWYASRKSPLMTKPEGEAKTIVKTSKYKAVKKMSSISPADRLEIRSLIAKYSKIPYRYANEKFSPNELETMNRLFDLIDRTADKGNFVCSENLRNGKLSHGANPSGRWQVINNLLSFRCAVGGPKDWNAFAAIQKRKTTPVGGDPKLSQALSDEVNKFMAVDHPFYTQAKKQEIIQVILSKPTDERTKLLLIRAEYP